MSEIEKLREQVAAFQCGCGELLKQIAEGDCQIFEGLEPGQPSPCQMIEYALQLSGVRFNGEPLEESKDAVKQTRRS